jgi:hypothetical protein
MLPKRALNVMDCEINRMLKLTANAVAPVSFSVPRKSKVNFAVDLFPHTAGPVPALSGADWLSGATSDPVLISLDPGSFGLTAEQQQTIREEQEAAIQREREEEAARNKKVCYFKNFNQKMRKIEFMNFFKFFSGITKT